MTAHGRHATYDGAFENALRWGQRTIIERSGKDESPEILQTMRIRYQMLRADVPELKTRTARWLLLPCVVSLPLYQTIKAQYSREQALGIVYEYIIAVIQNDLQENLPWIAKTMMKNRLLFPILFKATRGRMSKLNDPNGWTYEFLATEPGHLLDFNVHRCGMFTFLSAQGAPEMTPVLCRCDYYVTDKFLPKGIKLERTQTIADGAKVCDFRYIMG